MATPVFLQQTVNAVIQKNSPLSIRLNSFAPDGSVISMASGYTVSEIAFLPSSGPNVGATLVDRSGNFTAAFDATGLTLTIDSGSTSSLLTVLDAIQSSAQVVVSNDGSTTRSILGKINLVVDQLAIGL